MNAHRSLPQLACAWAWAQVQLYAELQPEALLPFLAASQSYSLEPALAVCERYGLVPEQVLSQLSSPAAPESIIASMPRAEIPCMMCAANSKCRQCLKHLFLQKHFWRQTHNHGDAMRHNASFGCHGGRRVGAAAQTCPVALIQVHVLGRMGAAGRALQLIIGRLADVPAAIAFVQSQADEELWQHLIQLALQDPESTGLTRRKLNFKCLCSLPCAFEQFLSMVEWLSAS